MGKDLSQKNIFFQKNTLCHSFRIIVIPSIVLSFLPDYCHSFRIIVIPSVLVSFLPNIVIPSKLFRELQILTSSKSFPYPKGEKNGHRRWPYMRVIHKKLNKSCSLDKFFFSWKKNVSRKKTSFSFFSKGHIFGIFILVS